MSSDIEATKKQRSCAYPLYPLPEAIRFAKRIYEGLGQGPFSRQTLAKGLGYSSFSGAASGKIGTLVHFGLLDRAHASYGFTALAQEILAYPAESSLPAIAKAAVRPVLFEKLFRRFEGKALPLDLAALLEAEFGITAKASPHAVMNFVGSLEFAGLVKENALLSLTEGSPDHPRPCSAAPLVVDSNRNQDGGVRIELPSGIVIIFPPVLAYRVSLGEFAPEIKSIGQKSAGLSPEKPGDFHLPPGGSLVK